MKLNTHLAAAIAAAGALIFWAPVADAQMGGGMQSTPQQADPGPPYGAGIAALNAQDFAEAIRNLRTAQRAAPREGAISYALGLAYKGAGDNQHARTAFAQSVRARNPPIGARLELGLVALALGDREPAIEQQTALQQMISTCSAECDDARRNELQAALGRLTQALDAPSQTP